jgi:hypothetical protein
MKLTSHRFIASLAATLFLMCVYGIASAQVTCHKVADNRAHVCWAAPITNTDGTPIILALTYNVELQSGATWTRVATGITATDYTSGVLTAGTYVYRVTAIAGGKSSDPSSTASKAVENPTPNAPTIIVVAQIREGQPPTYRIVQSVTLRPGEVVFAAPASMRPLFAGR